MKITKTKILSMAGLFFASLTYATTTYTLTELADGETTDSLTVTTYVTNADGTVSSVVSALTAVVNGDASETDGVEVSYYNWDSDSSTYVAGDADDYDIIVYDSGTDVYQGGTSIIGAGSNASGAGAGAKNLSGNKDFIANSTSSTNNGNSGGGATIYTTTGSKTVNGSFIGNVASVSGGSSGGGAFTMTTGTVTVNGDFIANYAIDITAGTLTGNGGAVRFASGTTFNAYDDFIANHASATGGAVCAAGTFNAYGDFIGNSAGTTGGAIWVGTSATTTVENGSFYSNTAGTNGGAIYLSASSSTVNIKATGANVYFTGNTAGTESNAIYNVGTVNFTASEGYSIVVNDGISGSSGIIAISGYGTTVFNNSVSSQDITVNDGATLALGSVVVDGVASSANLSASAISGAGTLSLVVNSSDDADANNIILGTMTDFTGSVALDLSAIYGDFSLDITTDSLDTDSLYVILGDGSVIEATEEGGVYSVVSSSDSSYYADFSISTTGSTITISGTAVPEPSTYAMIFGVVALGFAAYRRRK